MAKEPSASFWVRPSAWVWTLLLSSLSIFTLAMFLCLEGCRFSSRPLKAPEQQIVTSALSMWSNSKLSDPATISLLQAMVQQRKLRAMASCRWTRSQERSTFGYTDERGRILLNPSLCFSYHQATGAHQPHEGDLAITLATLFHESRHLISQDSEMLAYQKEWLFVRQFGRVASTPVAEELGHWEQQMPERIRCFLGPQAAEDIARSVEGKDAATDGGPSRPLSERRPGLHDLKAEVSRI